MTCYFSPRDFGPHEGTWRPCCGQHMCDYHFSRYDLRVYGAGKELARKVLSLVATRATQKK